MDETPLWLDMPGDPNITRSGVRSVPIRSTGHEKGRFTVSLAAMVDVQKLKPFVVFKGVRLTQLCSRCCCCSIEMDG